MLKAHCSFWSNHVPVVLCSPCLHEHRYCNIYCVPPCTVTSQLPFLLWHSCHSSFAAEVWQRVAPNLLYISQGNSNPLNPVTVPSTGSSWPSTSLYVMMVEGREFCIFTDHKPLTRTLPSRSTQHSPQQVRHLDFISQFTSDIRHVQGTDNLVADALSRVEVNELQQRQRMNPTLPLSSLRLHHSPLESVPMSASKATVICDFSIGVPRPCHSYHKRTHERCLTPSTPFHIPVCELWNVY